MARPEEKQNIAAAYYTLKGSAATVVGEICFWLYLIAGVYLALLFAAKILTIAGLPVPLPGAVSELQLLLLAGALFLVSGRKLW